MINVSVNTRQAVVEETELITTGSVGIQVQFNFSEDWDELTRVAVFRVGDEGDWYDMILDSTNICTVPWELLKEENEGEALFIGVEGTGAGGVVVIPTIWVSAGGIRPGAHSGNASGADPTPSQWSQIRDLATQAEASAEAAQAAASHQPIVSGDMWYVWDITQGAYVNTNVRATPSISVGEVTTLDAGDPATVENVGTENVAVFDFGIPRGDQGVSIQSVTKASGTGAPGTTDTYNVNLDDGTVAGTFDVYNGNEVEVDAEISGTSEHPVQNKVIKTALDDMLKNFAGAYSDTTAYATGKYVLYDGELYRCIVAIPSGGETWDSGHWTQVTVGGDLKKMMNYFATEYSASSTYAEGKLCIYQGQLYKCNTKIATAEAWNSSHWSTTNLGAAIYNLKIALAQPYNPSATYAVGDVCMHGDSLRKCTTAITTPEAWTNAHWGYVPDVMDVIGSGDLDASFTATTLTGAVNQLKTSLSGLKTDAFGTISLSGTNTGSDIQSGTFFYNYNVLVRATTLIQNGSAINLGVNAETVTVGALNNLNNFLTTKNVSSLFTVSISGASLRAYRSGNVITVLANSQANSIGAGNSVKLCSYPTGYTPAGISFTEYVGVNAPGLKRGIRLKSDGIYFENNDSSSYTYVQGAVVYMV